MRLVFCGTPAFAVPTLEAVIAAGHEIALVVTQPDRPAGRAMEIHPTPVKRVALGHGLPVVQPEKIKSNLEFRAALEEIRSGAAGLDAILVVAYGRIIPAWMLSLPRLGCINLHGSLLPKYRGAAPIQWAVANGETETGVTTMQLDEGLDTGPMLLAKAVGVASEETAADLFESLAEVGAGLMVETLEGLEAGTVRPVQQNHSEATLAPILKREDGLIDFAMSAHRIYDRWRAFQPWPGAFTTFRGKKMILHRMARVGGGGSATGGSGAFVVEGERLMVVCGEGSIVEIVELQMEGRKRMSAAEFLRGYQVRSDERLGH